MLNNELVTLHKKGDDGKTVEISVRSEQVEAYKKSGWKSAKPKSSTNQTEENEEK